MHDFVERLFDFQQLELAAAGSWAAPARTAGVAAQGGRPVKTMALSPQSFCLCSCVIPFEEQWPTAIEKEKFKRNQLESQMMSQVCRNMCVFPRF